jgi:hypothetical protein
MILTFFKESEKYGPRDGCNIELLDTFLKEVFRSFKTVSCVSSIKKLGKIYVKITEK